MQYIFVWVFFFFVNMSSLTVSLLLRNLMKIEIYVHLLLEIACSTSV